MQFKRSNNSQPKRQYCASAALREQLTNELSAISSSEEAVNWAHRVLGAKKGLTPADAARVEQAFQDRLASLIATADASGAQKPEPSIHAPGRKRHRSTVDKSMLALSAPRRIRDPDHVKSVAKQPCVICVGVQPMRTTCALRNRRHSAAR